ncbi:hypothetical protein [Microbacterium sp. CJ88]|uniref:hypothetical protein n=1 Tax=Microbacterium sp. CJ88 TaxID=3445672 RepID=UPI003F6600F3
MDPNQILVEVLRSTPWYCVVWLALSLSKRLRVGDVLFELTRMAICDAYVRRLRRYGASDKQIRAFIARFAGHESEKRDRGSIATE